VRASRTCECQQGSDIVGMGRLQRIDVTSAKVTGAHQVRATPGENGPLFSLGQHKFATLFQVKD
jgi:hypothetical protein